MARWGTRFKSDEEAKAYLEQQTEFGEDAEDPINVPPTGVMDRRLERQLEGRPQWQQRQMEFAYERGWRPIPTTERAETDEENTRLRDIRAHVSGWVPPPTRRHWCAKCADRIWCRRTDCAEETFRPNAVGAGRQFREGGARATYRATPESLWSLTTEDIVKIINFNENLSQDEVASLNALDDAIVEALRSVGAITENEYTKEDVEQHIEPVRAAIARLNDEDTLRSITRAMNDGAPEPEVPAPKGRSMTVDEIWGILDRDVTDEAQAFHRTFEDAVLRGLYQARIIPRGSTTYNRQDLERGLDAVRESINTTPGLTVTLMDKFTSAESLRTISAAEITKIIVFEGQTTPAFKLALERLESC